MTLNILIKKLIIIGLILGGIIVLAYLIFIRPWIMRMGTADNEVKMAMPGDGLVASPGTKYTQAITINAPKEIVWSYLIQVGYRRGGWYNWDFINRFASKDYFYENDKSADRIIPELQNVKEGDKIFIVPALGFDVSEFKKNEHMLLTANEGGKYVTAWVFLLKELDKNTTRLYVRWTSDLGDSFISKLMNTLIVEPGGAGIQQSQMLRGIKKRAEYDHSKNH